METIIWIYAFGVVISGIGYALYEPPISRPDAMLICFGWPLHLAMWVREFIRLNFGKR